MISHQDTHHLQKEQGSVEGRVPLVDIKTINPAIFRQLFMPLIVEMNGEEELEFLGDLLIPILYIHLTRGGCRAGFKGVGDAILQRAAATIGETVWQDLEWRDPRCY